jgi:Mg/Co/Ni transporter MgtE
MQPDNILTTGYLAKHPDQAARVLENLPRSMTVDLFSRLSPAKYLATFQHLIPSYGADLLDSMEEESRDQLMNALSTAQLSILLRFFDDFKRKNIISRLSSDKRKKIINQMQFPQSSVGSIMMPPTLSLPQDISVADALKQIKKSSRLLFPEIIVVNKELHYLGMISLNRLLKSAPQIKLGALIDYKFPSLAARKSLQDLTENPAWKLVRMLPVTDAKGLLIGVLDYAALSQHVTIALPESASPQIRQVSALELLFQALATLVESLINKLFPFDKTNTTKAGRHDNAM